MYLFSCHEVMINDMIVNLLPIKEFNQPLDWTSISLHIRTGIGTKAHDGSGKLLINYSL